MDLLRDGWTPLVLREAFYGITRFDAFQSSLGIARNTLTDRLSTLVEAGLMERRPYQTEPLRHDYVLTEMGRDFRTVLLTMNAWGDRWLSGDEGPPVDFLHDDCGKRTRPKVVCDCCGDPLTSENVSPRLGPGYPPHIAERPEVRARFGA